MTFDPTGAALRSKIADYLQLDETDLFSVVGVYAAAPGTCFSPQGQIETGKTAFEKLRASLKSKLCDEWDLCSKLKEDRYNDPINLIAAIGDAIAGLTIGVPPLVISTLIFKMGIRQLCEAPAT
jgi:hypothetical protein